MGRLIARDVSGRLFDSTLWTNSVEENRNADLYLKVRTRVEAYPLVDEPGCGKAALDYDHSHIPAHELSAADLSSAFDTIKQKTESTWNDQLWLIPDPPMEFYYLTSSDRERAFVPFIRCMIEIQRCPAGATPHLTIQVVKRVDPTMFFRSSAGGGEMTLDDGDLSEANTIPHEMGHHIGLSHVEEFSQGCLSHPDSSGRVGGDASCYGAPGSWSHENVMGGGSRVEDWNSYPWRYRMNRHWDIGHDWTRNPPPPHTRDHYHDPRGCPMPRVVRLYPAHVSDALPIAGVRDPDDTPDGGV
jgi:hypothetical protein